MFSCLSSISHFTVPNQGQIDTSLPNDYNSDLVTECFCVQEIISFPLIQVIAVREAVSLKYFFWAANIFVNVYIIGYSAYLHHLPSLVLAQRILLTENYFVNVTFEILLDLKF